MLKLFSSVSMLFLGVREFVRCVRKHRHECVSALLRHLSTFFGLVYVIPQRSALFRLPPLPFVPSPREVANV